MPAATVYLIGTGPGDPSLISVRGREVLETADVVVHDQPLPRQLHAMIPPAAERIAVGDETPRTAGAPAVHQLLADKACDGKTVARLTRGDPFVFGGGVAEAAFLHDRQIPFEVIPGVPPAIAVPAFAGIPIAGSGTGDLVIVIGGDDGATAPPPAIAWAHVAAAGGTIVCHASGSRMRTTIDALLDHGRNPAEPAALIHAGTLSHQQTTTSTLDHLRTLVRDAPDRDTAVLVVGPGVAHRARLQWFDRRPLFGRRVVVTRPRPQALELVRRLAALGAEPVQAPMIQIAPPDDPGTLDAVCAEIASFDWIVFTSANAVDNVLSRLWAGPADARALGTVRLCAVGPATAARLSRHHLKADLIPADHRAEGVARALGAQCRGTRVLWPRGDLAAPTLATALRGAGANVVDVVAYHTRPTDGGDDLLARLRERKVDVVTFTSASTVQQFVTRLGADVATDLLRTTAVAAIGPVTANAARDLGIETTIMPDESTVPALVAAIAGYFS